MIESASDGIAKIISSSKIMSGVKDFQKIFIELALQSNALEFGKFKLKSGRDSPYFFNAAKMLNGCDLSKLANCYVDAIEDSNVWNLTVFMVQHIKEFLGSIVATIFSQRGNSYPLSLIERKLRIMVKVAILLELIQLEMF